MSLAGSCYLSLGLKVCQDQLTVSALFYEKIISNRVGSSAKHVQTSIGSVADPPLRYMERLEHSDLSLGNYFN